MRRIILIISLLVASNAAAQTQNTAVTGTITDPSGIPYQNANIQATATGGSTSLNAIADIGGNFSLSLPSNISGGTFYRFAISTGGIIVPGGSGPQAFQVTILISGASQSVSAAINAVAPRLGSPGGAITPSGANTLLSNKCGSSANCVSAHGDARWTGDCVTDGSTAVVTSATANFTSADLNRHLWCSDTTASHHSLCITGSVLSIQSATQVTLSNNSTAVCLGTGSNYFLGIGIDDSAQWFAAYTASLASNLTLNGVPNSLVVDCGTYLVANNIQFANFNNFKHNITGSTLPWYPKCVTILIADNFNFAAAEAITGTTCVLICNANGQEKSLPPDYAQQSGMGVFRDFNIVGSGLSYPSQAGVIWIQTLNEFTNNQVVSLPGPSSTTSKTVQVNWYQGQVINNQIEPEADSTITNPPIGIDINATRVTAYNNRSFGNCGVNLQIEAGVYDVLVDANQFTNLASCTNPLINDLGSLFTVITRNYMNFNSASSTGIQTASGATTSFFVSQNLCIFTTAATCINNAGQMQVGTNRFYGASGTAYVNSGTLDHTFGQDYYGTFSGYTFTNTGTWFPLQSEACVSGTTGCAAACASGTSTITYSWTAARGKGYKNAPTIGISDETTAGGARISAKNTTTATVTCTGATDAFDYTITPNPF